ncbi:MAG: demethoxyubiquinone hydroxylase family protein [Aquabacterium sp.]|nr:demethoxyubiquinone hydroxylase family protein [Aquabacterium sp.]
MTTRTTAPPDTPAAGPAAVDASTWRALPSALRQELRTDHAGEAGAVMIYRGVLALARSPALRDFARHHLQTEQQHLDLIEAVVPLAGRSRLLPLWRLAGWLTGALPAMLGDRAVYATIDAVETFVDQHYADQVAWIDHHTAAATAAGRPDTAAAALPALRQLLERCRLDEVQHRDDARARRGSAGRWPQRLLVWGWTSLVGSGSAAAVRVSRWV